MMIGSIAIDGVRDGYGVETGARILDRPGVQNPWDCHPDVRDEHGRIEMPMGGFLVRTGDRVILVDTGVGNLQREDLYGGGLLDSLADLGVQPGDITDVLLTHLHYDHVGWTSTGGEVVFTNATFRAHAADWAYFVTAPDAVPGAVRKLTPITEQLELFDSEQTLAPGVDARPAPGHTPGSTVFVISSEGERALLLGDIAHSVVELAEPDWEAVYDVDKQAAKAVRNAIAEEALDTDTYVVPAHFPKMAFGRVVTTGAGRRWLAV